MRFPSAADLINLATLLVKAAAILCGLCGASDAAAPVVRITQQDCRSGSRCEIAYWSGTVIGRLPDNRLAVLTCGHGYQQSQPVNVEIDSTGWSEGRFVLLDPSADLGLIGVPSNARVPCLPVAAQMPDLASTTLTVSGYPRGQNPLRTRSGRMAGVPLGGGVWPLSTTFIPGESGGAVLVSNRVVGVIVATDTFNPLNPLDLNKQGYVVGWPAVAKFVQQCAAQTGGQITYTDPDVQASPPSPGVATAPGNPQQAGGTGPQPYVRVELGEPAAQPSSAPPAAAPPAAPPLGGAQRGAFPGGSAGAGGDSATDESIDWSTVTVVILVKKQPGVSGIRGSLRSTWERLAAGPLTRELNDRLDGKATIVVLFERTNPSAYLATVEAAGMPGDDAVSVVALVEKQFAGIRGFIVGKLAAVFRARAESALKNAPVEVILERLEPDVYSAVRDATELKEPTEGGVKVGKVLEAAWMTVVFLALSVIAGFGLAVGWEVGTQTILKVLGGSCGCSGF